MSAEADQPPDSQPPTPERRRRPRYRGTHPRKFEERYKEQAPEQFPQMQEHIRAQGRTPAGSHVPIMVDEVIAALRPRPGAIVADCTVGHGGHALAFLRAIAPNGALLGFDVDGAQLERTRARLAAALVAEPPRDAAPAESTTAAKSCPTVQFRLFHSNFAGLPGVLAREEIAGCDILFADLGVSSMQIDDPARGFSYKHDGPLDMRMDARVQRTAADWLRTISEADLAKALTDLADEPDAEAIAGAIVRARSSRPLERTRELAALVAAAKGRGGAPQAARPNPIAAGEPHPAARTFQALRILVNDELGALRNLLRIAPECLRSGGRIGILTFHSGEDRLVKHAFRDGIAAGLYATVLDEPIRAGAEERRANPRSAAAKLRWATRL